MMLLLGVFAKALLWFGGVVVLILLVAFIVKRGKGAGL